MKKGGGSMRQTAVVGALLAALVLPVQAQQAQKEQPQGQAEHPQTGQAAPEQRQAAPAPATSAASVPAQPPAAQPQPAPVQPPKAAKAKKSKVYGTVQTVDAASNKITVKTKKGELRELNLGEGTQITKGGNYKAVTLADVKEGNQVEIRMEGDSVKTIHVQVKAR